MANTTNLDLEKPLGTDKALVARLNSNSDKIDAWAGSTNQALGNLIPKTGNTYTGDLNDLPTGRVYTGSGITNAPTSSNYWFIDTIVYGTNAVQYAQDRNAAVNVWTRNKSQGTWREWQKLALKSDIKYKTVTKTVTIPAGTSTEQEYAVDFTNDVTVDYMLVSVTIGLYMLPYVVGDAVKTQVFSYSRSERRLVIKNRSTVWNNMQLVAVFTKLD